MKKLIFLCIALAITTFSIITLNISPVINQLGSFDSHENCKKYSDKYNFIKDKKVNEILSEEEEIDPLDPLNPLNQRDHNILTISNEDKKKELLDFLKEGENKCKRDKAIAGLEYSSFIINIAFGFSSVILSLLYFLGVGNNLGKIVGLFGLGTGVIGFILSCIYAIYSGIIFNNDVAGKSFNNFSLKYRNSIPKIDSEGAYLKWDDSKNSYVCIFYDKDNKDSLYLKYSDYKNEYLNYKKDVAYAVYENNFKYQYVKGCIKGNPFNSIFYNRFRLLANYIDPYIIYPYYELWDTCQQLDEKKKVYQKSGGGKFFYYDENNKKLGECDKLFYIPDINLSNEKKDIYDKWLASIVLSYFISAFNLGLAIIGLLLFKDLKGLNNGIVSIK